MTTYFAVANPADDTVHTFDVYATALELPPQGREVVCMGGTAWPDGFGHAPVAGFRASNPEIRWVASIVMREDAMQPEGYHYNRAHRDAQDPRLVTMWDQLWRFGITRLYGNV